MRRWVAIMSSVAALMAIGVAASYTPDLDPATVEARWSGPSSRYEQIDGMRVHLRDEGQGIPVLLIHGTSSSLHTWDGWAAALTDVARIVRFDLPGFGLTGPEPDGDYGVDRFIRAVDAGADHAGFSCFVIGGNSLGGLVAWRYALAHPDRVGGLVLVNAAGLPRDDMPLLIKLGRWPAVGDVLPWFTPRAVVDDQIRRAYGDPARITQDVRDRYWDLLRRAGNRVAFTRYTRTLRPTVGHERIGGITAPTLVMWGDLDQLIPVAHAAEFAERLPVADTVVYPGVGHVPMEEIPDRSAVDVRDFLEVHRPCAVSEQTPIAADESAEEDP